MGTTGIGQILLKSFSLECPGNQMSSAKRLVRTGKVLNRKDSTATGAGLRIDADIKTDDSRSEAPDGKWNVWLEMKPYSEGHCHSSKASPRLTSLRKSCATQQPRC